MQDISNIKEKRSKMQNVKSNIKSDIQTEKKDATNNVNEDNKRNITKTYIDSNGYNIVMKYLTKDQLLKIKTDLTVVPHMPDAKPEDIEKMKYAVYSYTEDGKNIIIPRYYGISRFGKPDRVDFDEAEEVDMTFTKTLRKKQQDVVDLCIKYMEKNGGGLLSVPCGFGKTICALYIAQKLGLKTLVVVHKTFLLNQWIDRALNFLNIKIDNIGIIKQKKCDINGKDLVIGLIHTISKREYNDLYKQFGLVIFDEAHHVCARFFSKTLMKTSSKYTLSLTATPYRNDGLIKVMYWFTGGTIYREKIKMNVNVVVKTVTHRSKDTKNFREYQRWFNGGLRPNPQKMSRNLMKIDSRNNTIISMIDYMRKTYPDRKILVLSEMIDHLTLLKTSVDELIKKDVDAGIIDEDEIYTCYYIGDSKQHEREEAEEMGDIIFATYQMANEGLDISRLNTLIYATPKKDIVQSVGRIMRKILSTGDVRPLIIDIQDELSVFTKWSENRRDYYKKCKYQIEDYFLEDSEFMTPNRFYGVDDIKDEDRPTHNKNIYMNRMINECNAHYADFKKDKGIMDDMCEKLDKIFKINTVKSDYEIDFDKFEKDHNLTKEKLEILEDVTPFKLRDILHVDNMTELDYITTVLKTADEDSVLDLDKDINLDPDDNFDDDNNSNSNNNDNNSKSTLTTEMMKYRGNDEIQKMKRIQQKIKTKRLV